MTALETPSYQLQMTDLGAEVAGRCAWGTTVLAIPDGTTMDEWQALGAYLATMSTSVAWAVGDWLYFAERNWEVDHDGHVITAGTAEVRRRLDELGIDPEHAVRARRVAKKFRPTERHEHVTWAHHLEVTPLDDQAAHHLLNEAAEHRWSTRQLREHVRRAQAIDTTGQQALEGMAKPVRLSVKFTGAADRQTLEVAAERIGRVLADLGLDGEVKVA